MRLAALFFIGIVLILAGFQGNLGSMLGAIIDPANMVDISGGGPTTATTSTPVTNLLGGIGPSYV